MSAFTGGCLCGAVRYEAEGPPAFSVFCHCRDCQRASGSIGFPVMGVPAATFRVTGPVRRHQAPSVNGRGAARNFCTECGSTVFGGEPETGEGLTNLYIGSLDDPSAFKVEAVIFTRDRTAWTPPFEGAHEFEEMPGEPPA